MVLRKVDAPYSRVEAWVYDRFIADAVHTATSGLLDEVAAMAPPGGHLLDIGCGGGHFSLALAERADQCRVTGIDLSPQQVARARTRAHAQPADVASRVEFDVGTALELPFPENNFDAAVSVGSIKHWPDRRRGVEEMARVVKPGGRVTIVELDRDAPRPALLAWAARLGVPHPFRVAFARAFARLIIDPSIGVEEGRQLLDDTGLQDAKAQSDNEFPFVTLSGVIGRSGR